jgi:hypothetical protein
MQAHADRKLESAHEIENLARGVFAPENLRAFRAAHVGHDGVVVLNVDLLHWDEHHIGVETLHRCRMFPSSHL